MITENVHYVGVNDRRTDLFENMLPLPQGVSYNSYLIVDDQTALVESVELNFCDVFVEQICAQLQGKKLNYLIVNHMEPDHSGSIAILKRYFPEMKLVGNARTRAMLEGYYGLTDDFLEVKEGSEISLGHHTLRFYMTPMLHWPETMMTYCVEPQILFSGDAFGCFGALNGGTTDDELDVDGYWDEMTRYYANIVGKYAAQVQTALKKLADLPISYICSTHGPVWHQQVCKVVDIYDKLSRHQPLAEGAVVIYASMYGHTTRMAEAVAQGLVAARCPRVQVYDASRTDASFLLRDLYKYNRVAIGCPTYNANLYPAVEALLAKVELRGLKGRILGYFGAYTWAGAAVKKLAQFAETMQWQTIEPVEMKMAPTADTLAACQNLGKALMAAKEQ